VRHLREAQGGNIKIFVGGTIPQEDVEPLMSSGAAGVFNASQRIEDVVAEVDRLLDDA
jgi:methylmalonyl-CoA mutase C-terminal domain/subunit